MFALENADVFYGKAPALHGVSIAFEPGQVVALVGRNGAGKSTTLKTLCGLLPCHHGRRLLDGADVTHMGPEELNRAGVAYVPEDRQIFPTLTVEENLRMAQVVRRNGNWTIPLVFDLFSRLAERRNALGQALSGGEQQMLSIARALLTNPSVLLMDEPTEGLAPVIVETLTAALIKLRGESGLSIILVEQNSRVAFEFSDRSVVLDKGRIVYDGASAVLRDDPDRLAKVIGVSE